MYILTFVKFPIGIMFNRKSYDRHTVSVFEIIAAYIANLYYHHFYGEAMRLKVDKAVSSVTDGYVHAVKAYLSALKKPEYYRSSIIGIHNYYQTTTKFTTISMKDCINDIVQQFIPSKFYDAMDEKQRETILHNVLMDSVRNFSNEVLCGGLLVNIIDNHSDNDTAQMVKQKMVDCLFFEREKVFRKFFKTMVDPDKKIKPDDMRVSAMMKTELHNLIKLHSELTAKYDKQTVLLEKYKSVLNGKNEHIQKLTYSIKKLSSELDLSKRQLPPIIIPSSPTRVAPPTPIESPPQMSVPPPSQVSSPIEHIEPNENVFFAAGLID